MAKVIANSVELQAMLSVFHQLQTAAVAGEASGRDLGF